MRTKRFLAAFLALCLSLALLPSGVIAVESEAEAELPAPEYQQLEAAQSDLEDREESVEALLDVAESPAMPTSAARPAPKPAPNAERATARQDSGMNTRLKM